VRLLFDENLSEALLPALADLYPGSLHVRSVGRGGASDGEIWTLAAGEDCILVTRDEDFLQLSVLRGAPPKVEAAAKRKSKASAARIDSSR
jgi:predicted nuclease of predicted toxin-antitoxin system